MPARAKRVAVVIVEPLAGADSTEKYTSFVAALGVLLTFTYY